MFKRMWVRMSAPIAAEHFHVDLMSICIVGLRRQKMNLKEAEEVALKKLCHCGGHRARIRNSFSLIVV